MYHVYFIAGWHGLMPREERLIREGADKLSNQELLSIFLRTKAARETVFQVSQGFLSSISSLNDLKYLTLLKLQSKFRSGPVRRRLLSYEPLLSLNVVSIRLKLAGENRSLNGRSKTSSQMQVSGEIKARMFDSYLSQQSSSDHPSSR